ncbi:protein downstream neighbor of son homolog [Pectinophora gossypiella]|uniref:protein downstream neighbor of son homolog n=1 Tax=Pectinophora gossypiella TaxID=13191 RepID=UPI00214E7742|nr:protein downstream neighbor of son homolog [Pectinophora gossypiella]
MEPTSPWKKPNEVMRLHRLKKRKKTLQERITQPSGSGKKETIQQESVNLDFSRILHGDKTKNPFSKNSTQQSKKPKLEVDPQLEESSDNTLYALLNLPAKVPEKPAQDVDTEKLSTFSNLLQKFTAEHTVETVVEQKCKHLPIDWALKTKLRLMSPKPFAWSSKLKASEEASGITGFVRCVDTTMSQTLDTSPRARLHQACLYWQHPHLPWLQLYPRCGGRVAGTNALASHEDITEALHREWTESFRSLFQLLRALHCPYFYVCANTFTCLFRAAGVCGVSEPCAFIAPTTRGFRQALQQEDVEFTMPLRSNKKKLNTSNEDQAKNLSFDSSYSTMDEGKDDSGDEEDPDAFLSQLGLETDVIKKINNAQSRLEAGAESSVDRAAESLVMARGAEAQALFNFLLNCRSAAARAGPLAAVPPTLLAPTAFHGATLASLKIRENVILSDSKKFYSLELRGPVLPSAVHALLGVVRGGEYSATFAHLAPTLAFSWAAAAVAKDESSKENEPNHFTKAFNKENLSDCGISEELLQLLCSSDASIIKPLDSVKYNPEDDTYTW